jgi:hypothetical protein
MDDPGGYVIQYFTEGIQQITTHTVCSGNAIDKPAAARFLAPSNGSIAFQVANNSTLSQS